jgi:hypothetical protein
MDTNLIRPSVVNKRGIRPNDLDEDFLVSFPGNLSTEIPAPPKK